MGRQATLGVQDGELSAFIAAKLMAMGGQSERADRMLKWAARQNDPNVVAASVNPWLKPSRSLR